MAIGPEARNKYPVWQVSCREMDERKHVRISRSGQRTLLGIMGPGKMSTSRKFH